MTATTFAPEIETPHGTCAGTVIVHGDLTVECTEGWACELPRFLHDFSVECDDATCCPG